MAPSPRPWQLTLAKIEGALPFVPESLAQCLAQRSLRRLWSEHIRDYPFENRGLEHNPGLDAGELMRSWYAEERRDVLSWIARRAPLPSPMPPNSPWRPRGCRRGSPRSMRPQTTHWNGSMSCSEPT